jgi:hypothetical protein
MRFTHIAILALTAAFAVGQASKSAPASFTGSKTWTQPKTPWGDPDLQGTWTSDDCIGSQMNRAATFGDRAYYTEQELAQRQGQLERQQETDLQETVGENARVGTGPPAHWAERARRTLQADVAGDRPPERQDPRLAPRGPDQADSGRSRQQ